ncbi:TPA: 50S ribosomal protein L15 [Patescibacteria group bacterium]|uniref:Large ribosomal subunit protein uL15 n=2 Tax=Bacteria division Kazan-3B-28 TaxID=1798534 RepID=A0A0G1KUF7_UNCK3|nr:MAG: 50S ribosomal protein L15 [candidate division Kazan bacterium GW2011_GWA1_44_22]KKT87120.1 MAG: 50S ribosomal protein L15 [candidate division Kazan bacterium GW2011_GWB1_45_10]HAR54931.1 50S ribosomal protein L15 [Patescibacteria group bacterium]HCR41904.1 50S ribosomal protein L15 [Patescibacteria group bacterium]
MNIQELTQLRTKNKGRRRVGRGGGSGRGTTSGRGTKGQKARTGGNVPAHFEGGQKPLMQIIPKKRGFRRPNRPRALILNVQDLPKLADNKALTIKILRDKGYLNGFDYVKILGQGEITVPIELEVHKISASAQNKIEAVGGKVKIVE